MFNTPDYTALINVARAYTDMREAVAEDDSDERAKKAKENDPQNKADAEAKRRRDLRKPIGGKLDKVVKDVQGKNLSSAADKVIKDVQGEDKKKKEAEERRAKLKAKFGGRQGRIIRQPGKDMAADAYMAMDGNKRAQKRVMNQAAIKDAKDEGEARRKRKEEGKDRTPPPQPTQKLRREGMDFTKASGGLMLPRRMKGGSGPALTMAGAKGLDKGPKSRKSLYKGKEADFGSSKKLILPN